MKNDYKVRAQKFIEDFFPYIEETLHRRVIHLYELSDCVAQYCIEKHRRVIMKSGCSRAAFITSDYVVKYDYVKDAFCGNSSDELRAYQEIKKMGFEHLFAEISCFTYKGYNFYIMPRVSGIQPFGDDDVLYEYLSYEEQDFIDEYFHDLHSGNFGFEKNQLKIIDYAWNSLGK